MEKRGSETRRREKNEQDGFLKWDRGTGAEVARGAPYGLVNLTLPARELRRQQGRGIEGARERETEPARDYEGSVEAQKA